MPNTARAFDLLDDNRYDDEHDYDTTTEDREERNRVAASLRHLRQAIRCSVTSDLLAEKKRQASLLQVYRRAEWQSPKAGL